MSRDTPLLVLTAAGSALCWWPAMIEPSIDFSRWVLLVLIALMTGLAATLSEGYWLRFVGASIAGSFVGLCCGVVLFPSSDGIANSYAPLAVIVATLATVPVSFVAGLVGRKLSVSNENYRRAIWLALTCCAAFGPVALALTPPLVAHRIAHNDQVAAERFASLKSAVERTIAESGDPERICDGRTLKQYYSGPPFSEEDWRRLAGNYVTEGGYSFMVLCGKKGKYIVHATSWTSDGTRQFCTDESGRIGCGMGWNRSGYGCVACMK